jgi:hypothetical protein
MIEKSNSTSLVLATIAILGQPPSAGNPLFDENQQATMWTRTGNYAARHCQPVAHFEKMERILVGVT